MALAHIEDVQVQALPSQPLVGDAQASYDATSDELAFWIGGGPRPHITEPANAYVSILFDLDDGRAIGVRVEHFLAFAVHRFPALQALSDYLGLVPREEGDTTLFSDRLAVVATPHDEEQGNQFKAVIEHIIDLTGGFDTGIVLEGETDTE